MCKETRVFAAALVAVLVLAGTQALAQAPRANVDLRPASLANVLAASNLGAIQNAQLGTLSSLCAVGGKMYGAGDGKVVLLGEDGAAVRTFSTNIKSPVIAAHGSQGLVIGDRAAKVVSAMDLNTGKLTTLLDLKKVTDTDRRAVPNASLITEGDFTAVAHDGKNLLVAFSAGFSSPIFSIDPSSGKIVGRGWAAGPNPVAMAFQNNTLLVLDGKARQIRNYTQQLKPSQTWTEVDVADPKGLAVINNEIRVLSPGGKNILRVRTDLAGLTRVTRAVAAINPAVAAAAAAAIAQPRKYAVLICGDIAENFWGECFWNDTVWMYKTLLNAGYHKNNIYVLYGYGADYNSANPRYKHPDKVTDFPATIGWVNKVFDGLKNGDAANGILKMKDNDTLFVWTFDHGGGGDNACLCLWDGNMWDTDFAAKLNAVAYEKRAIFMQQCRSGGFIDNLRNAKTYISTACKANENAHPADTENETYNGKPYSHGEYNYYIISALAGQNPLGGAVNADSNGNGKVSAKEAHAWNVAHESRSETPQQNDMGGIGNNFYIKN